jgi:glycine/D-amino acid oxidase-like deaminating enzyme
VTGPVHTPDHDVIIIGSGVVGASCAYELALAGLRVLVIDRGGLASGTTASGEGNILVSDKPPGPELDLARASIARWADYAAELSEPFEYEPKGGVVVATEPTDRLPLADLVARHRDAGVAAQLLDGRELRQLEPHLAPDLELGAHYPDDAQVQPVLASSALLADARRLGVELRPGCEVLGFEHDAFGRLVAVRTSQGSFGAGAFVNAAGPWSTAVARLAGSDLPVRPRRGHLLVTVPVGPLVRHKVYEADYLSTLTADTTEAQVSAVVESTPSGTILLGSSRELAGFDTTVDLEVVRRIAARARRLFPVLADVDLLRVYTGLRPWVPDHLPIIGEDPHVRGLWHATGHEGAGIGLAPATGQLIRAGITDTPAPVDPLPFRVARPSLRGAAARGLTSDAGGDTRARARRG